MINLPHIFETHLSMKTIFLKLRLGFFAALVLMLGGWANAAPFNKQIDFRQPDGSIISLHAKGDDFQAVFETLEGYTVVYDQTEHAYCFARRGASGDLESLGVQAHLVKPATLGLAKHERQSDEVRISQAQARRQAWENQTQIKERWQSRLEKLHQAQAVANGESLARPPAFTISGNKLGLTILVDFSDDVATIPQAELIDFCNGDNYHSFGNNGSVKQFYYDNSGGLLVYSNVVTVYVRVPQPKSFYNNVNQGSGPQANLLIRDAINALKALPNYNTTILPTFANLTADVSGRVTACNILFAGDNSGVFAQGLWPSAGTLNFVGPQPLGNGKTVFRYQITNIGASPSIGTFCHENGHMLCDYPDLYDYDNTDSAGGAGNYCLMSYGVYNGDERNPAQICAYLKRASGWGTTIELNPFTSLFGNLPVATTTATNINKFYRYQKPGTPTEYFIIENRQLYGHDADLPGAGLLIWHVDELGDRDNQSTAYNNAHLNYELSLQQADNLFDFERNINYGDANDPYYAGNPAAGYANEFSDSTSPKAFWWDGTASGLKISTISALAPNMTFIVGYGSPTNNIPLTAPPGPWGTNLAVLNGSNPNGYWLLFVQDDAVLDIGKITNGWSVNLTTADLVGHVSDNAIYASQTNTTIPYGTNYFVTLSVTNYGPSTSSNVLVTDLLPTGGLTLLSSNATAGPLSLVGSTLVWSVGTLPANAGASLNLALHSFASGSFTNVATVSSLTADPNPDDDTVFSVINVGAPPPPPVLASFAFLGGTNGFEIYVTGDSAYPTVVQASTNLVNWESLFTANPPFYYTNFVTTNYPVRFYRAVIGP
jgi:M6 family metalloprotease-like protein/uncharacterized repeat protein (TIGR01451 family)